MAKRVYTKKGDIYEIIVDNAYKKYIQLIGFDIEQLSSDTFRVFKREYPIDYNPDMDEILNDDIDFYVHSFASGGIHDGIWKLVYRSKDIGKLEGIKFRSPGELPPPGVKISNHIHKKWRTWTLDGNNEFVIYGKLPKEWKIADLGTIFQPKHVLYKIRNGNFPFEPKYEE